MVRGCRPQVVKRASKQLDAVGVETWNRHVPDAGSVRWIGKYVHWAARSACVDVARTGAPTLPRRVAVTVTWPTDREDGMT